MTVHTEPVLPVPPPPVVIPIGQHQFAVHLGNTQDGRRLVDLVEVTPPLPKLSYNQWTKLTLVLSTALRLEGFSVTAIARDRFMGIKDGMVAL